MNKLNKIFIIIIALTCASFAYYFKTLNLMQWERPGLFIFVIAIIIALRIGFEFEITRGE